MINNFKEEQINKVKTQRQQTASARLQKRRQVKDKRKTMK
jgi:hypothetical protein